MNIETTSERMSALPHSKMPLFRDSIEFIDVIINCNTDKSYCDEFIRAVALCKHDKFNSVFKVISDGRLQYFTQCSSCGEQGRNITKYDAYRLAKGSEIKELDVDLYNKRVSYVHHIINEYEAHVIGDLSKQIMDDSKVDRDRYNAYLLSNEWINKRNYVIDRANGICEGCRIKPAEQVHHLTYKHLFNELLFELVAVCRECHERIHPHMTR